MKNIALFLSILVTTVLISAVSAYSGSGPFGAFGPADYTGMTQDSTPVHTASGAGTGPYGAFAVIEAGPGEVSKLAATPGGSGPFGAFASYGMIPGSGSVTLDKSDCIVLAKNCIPDR